MLASTSVASPDETEQITAGTLAHRALEQWIETSGYRNKSPTVALAKAADACLERIGQGPPPRWKLVRARLLARGEALAALIGSRAAPEIISETEIADPELKLRGRPDLLLLGPEMVLIDLKTQTLAENAVPEWVSFQLNLYAHLISTTYGRYPDRVEVFSLNRGQIPVRVTDQTVQAAIEALAAARNNASNAAHPDPAICFYCDRRFICQPHWDVAPNWPEADCLEGIVERIEVAANGLAAVRVTGAEGPTWVSGIPLTDITGGAVGDRIKMVRLRRTAATLDDRAAWRWRLISAARLISADA